MKFTNGKAKEMAKAIRTIVINAVIFGVGLIAGMTLKASLELFHYAFTSQGDYYEAVMVAFVGCAFGLATFGCMSVIYLLITNNNK